MTFLPLSYANAEKIVNKSIVKLHRVKMITINGSIKVKKYPAITKPGHKENQLIILTTYKYFQRFDSEFLKLTETCSFHQAKSEFILVAAKVIMKPIIGGPKPPPTRSNRTESINRIKLPYFLSINPITHIIRIIETIIARIPVIRRLGTMVIAGSPFKIS